MLESTTPRTPSRSSSSFEHLRPRSRRIPNTRICPSQRPACLLRSSPRTLRAPASAGRDIAAAFRADEALLLLPDVIAPGHLLPLLHDLLHPIPRTLAEPAECQKQIEEQAYLDEKCDHVRGQQGGEPVHIGLMNRPIALEGVDPCATGVGGETVCEYRLFGKRRGELESFTVRR